MSTWRLHQKTLNSYEFSLMPSLNKNRFLTLSKAEFVEKKENIIFLGNCSFKIKFVQKYLANPHFMINKKNPF
ncbi:ATP-binding protein [Peribacillus loiseleuriae]|uniref:ATP-binding protein n=1 Tax=Peribacillus loiseleuriae TaxID=1679170 RepID=UPI003CFE928B